jgi:hypothetical protein
MKQQHPQVPGVEKQLQFSSCSDLSYVHSCIRLVAAVQMLSRAHVAADAVHAYAPYPSCLAKLCAASLTKFICMQTCCLLTTAAVFCVLPCQVTSNIPAHRFLRCLLEEGGRDIDGTNDLPAKLLLADGCCCLVRAGVPGYIGHPCALLPTLPG